MPESTNNLDSQSELKIALECITAYYTDLIQAIIRGGELPTPPSLHATTLSGAEQAFIASIGRSQQEMANHINILLNGSMLSTPSL